MEYSEDEYLMLSGIQHFAFCRRQWALIHIEQQWAENYRTTDGKIMHRNVHDSGFNESRGSVLTVRALPVASAALGISGECDVVEFRPDPNGVRIHGREGRYSVCPVEYKRGEPKLDDCDALQLCAQAMCLEEMLCCEIPFGALYYGETRHRLKVELTQELRGRVSAICGEMHDYFRRRYTPVVKRTRSCNACSLKELCLPSISGRSAAEYIKERLGGEVL